ncbi:NAD-glutamate dehydrogenase [Siculibacillus lacustris]|uniref:NAD-glutamate dehydrogenase n=1 Tax=Siculibacillus lacustris TaxID=1549641 RepID=A0A4Q9VV15_9HYPH|nr:NAD-glutamate dehydrogenase [Siculibacillus lacustris]TBW40071.1 NAD-glutamate dehydrogenase [Siculibacillus lacustris]
MVGTDGTPASSHESAIGDKAAADPVFARFAGLLFERAPAEDLAGASADDLEAWARDAWAVFGRRQGEGHTIRVSDLAGPGGCTATVVDILNDDMPFLFDSVTGAVVEAGHEIRLVLHPIFTVQRDRDGGLLTFEASEASGRGAGRESLIRIHLAPIADPAARGALIDDLDRTLADVRAAVDDWTAMLARVEAQIAGTSTASAPLAAVARGEAVAFLNWLRDGHFTFLGTRDYRFGDGAGGAYVEPLAATGLGILRDPDVRVLKRGVESLNAAAAIGAFVRAPEPILVTKSNVRSRVHRRVAMDYVGVKSWGPDGTLIGELRILGLFTASAYTSSAETVPFVQAKVARVVARAGFPADGHSGKALRHVLESFPRDELFQIDEATLDTFALAVLALGERPRIRVLARRDPFDRFVSVLAFVPRDRYDTTLRLRIGALLEQRFDGRVESATPTFPEGALTRIHYIVGRTSGQTPEIAAEVLERDVAALVRTWRDAFVEQLAASLVPDAARWVDAFGAAYREAIDPAAAAIDVATMRGLGEDRRTAVDFYRRPGEAADRLALKLFDAVAPIPLSDRVPILEAMGLRVIDESTYRVTPSEGGAIFVHDMALAHAGGAAIELSGDLERRLEDLFTAVWAGRAENDGFNALVLDAGLDRREAALLRAIGRHLRQIGLPHTPEALAGALRRSPDAARALVAAFRARFDPALGAGRVAATAAARTAVERALEAIVGLDDDTIVRRFAGHVEAMVRTDFFRPDRDGLPRDTLAFKLDPAGLAEMPAPRPFREIWVCGPTVEGLHLRFGAVARGGLRWSDRAQDFRTEVLGLAKAQQVKNAVIVPVGAKGGFVPKGSTVGLSREVVQAQGVAAYRLFVGRLLDLTDDIVDGVVVPPPAVLRHDGDDPYLVVAADKGTATFSDLANGLARERGFWLDDAFASGGSVGYDHKKMGITARGALEAVKRHFREIDVDVTTTPIRVIGIGDLSGDVFGNGLTALPTLRLVAAFDHRDIFLDPDPDTEASFAERRRLFALPRSSWADYDPRLISAGGGVFSRAAKSIPLSPPIRALTGIEADHAPPAVVIRALLKASVDLLWFGGIGTYVRASAETDAQVGDKANDGVRVTGLELGARVVAEGGNLGMTQRARIEYGAAGGRCNCDAIDNSAGVNCSDVEVNIKIALASAVVAGRLDRAGRDALLASMTDAVAELVLVNNRRQTLAISLTERQGVGDLLHQRRLVGELERRGRLDRKVETLPDDAGFAQREKARRGLGRAEIAVIAAHAKLSLKADLLAARVTEDPFFAPELAASFPPAMRESFAGDIAGHRLAREIVATRLANALVDLGGPTFVVRVADRTAADPATVARAFAAARAIFRAEALIATIDGLGGLAGTTLLELAGSLRDHLIEATVRLVRPFASGEGIAQVVERFGGVVALVEGEIEALLPLPAVEALERQRGRLAAEGVPEEAALRLSRLGLLVEVLDVAPVAERTGRAPAEVAAVHFAVGERLAIGRLVAAAKAVPVADPFDGLALDRAVRTIGDAQRRIVADVLAAGGLDAWVGRRGGDVARVLAAIAEIVEEAGAGVSRFTVAAALLADLAEDT